MRIFKISLLLILTPCITFGQFVEKKIYNIQKIQNAPKINGVLSDPAWKNLDIARNFSQIEPNNGRS